MSRARKPRSVAIELPGERRGARVGHVLADVVEHELLGLGHGDGGCADRVGEAGARVHLAHDLGHAGERGLVGVDDDVDALAEHVELTVGDQDGDLDQRVAAEVEAGHLAVDPHQTIVHGVTLCLARGEGPLPRVSSLRDRLVVHCRGVGCGAVENPAARSAAQEIAAGYATEGAALELGCVRRRRHGRPGRAGAHPVRDAQPARPGRRRHRHRQDQDAAGDRRAAVRGGRAGAARGRQGRPVRDGAAGRARPEDRRSGRGHRRRLGADGVPGRVPVARRRQLGGADPGHAHAVRPDPAEQGARPQRHPGVHARADLPLGRPARAAAAGHQGPARGHPAPHLATRARPTSRASAGSRRRPRA